MKPKLILCLALVLIGGSPSLVQTSEADVEPSTIAGQSLDSLLNAFFPGKGLNDLYVGDWVTKIQHLPAQDRNRIAVAAARELSLRTPNGDLITAETVDELLYRKPITPSESALRKLCERDDRVVSLLRDMEALRLISDPGVIAPLIEMLDFPGVKTDIRNEATQALSQLTGRQYNNEYEYFAPQKHAQFVQWWREWWVKNKDRHPVLDEELRKTVADRVTGIRNQIFLEVKGYGGQPASAYGLFDRWSNPDDVTVIGTDSSMYSFTAPGSKGQILLRIAARFETPCYELKPALARTDLNGLAGDWQALGSKAKVKIRRAHQEELLGTDIVIVVDAASEDQRFPELVHNCLQKPLNPSSP